MTREDFENLMDENNFIYTLCYGNKCAGYVEFTYYVTIESFNLEILPNAKDIETEYLDGETYIMTVKIYN